MRDPTVRDTVPRDPTSLGFPGTVTRPKLARVLELAMTSASSDQIPAVNLEHSQNFTDLHDESIAVPTLSAPQVLL